MQVDVLIIGQGICGTMLSWWLEKAGMSYVVADDPKPDSASRVAAGVINPVTGRRMVKTWMIDDLMPFVHGVYEDMGKKFSRKLISLLNTIDFFPTPQMRNAFRLRFEEDQQYLLPVSDGKEWNPHFRYDFGYGQISPCYLVDLKGLLSCYRNWLAGQGRLYEKRFDGSELIPGEKNIRYEEFQCGAVVFCDGIGSCENPLFKNLPFAPNKGEALLAAISELPADHIYKKGMNLVPLSGDLFWIGSSYEWEFRNQEPTEAFRQRTTRLLKDWLKRPFTITDHLSSVRPATLERRPFVGTHPQYPRVCILNGMGTKGCSLAPYFAKQLADHLAHGAQIHPDADIKRFTRILSRPSIG